MKNVEETQFHIFWKKRENTSYTPEHRELYNGNIKEQIYVSRILKENYERRVYDGWYIASTAYVNCGPPPHVLLFAVLDVNIYILHNFPLNQFEQVKLGETVNFGL